MDDITVAKSTKPRISADESARRQVRRRSDVVDAYEEELAVQRDCGKALQAAAAAGRKITLTSCNSKAN
jgi:hypothetical protein